MPTYTRAYIPGGAFFFTLVTYRRQPILGQSVARTALRNAIEDVRAVRPFHIDALVLLPDHLHTIWTLPSEDADFSTHWRLIKYRTTRELAQLVTMDTLQSTSRQKKQERPVWQRRFWEHAVRDEDEFSALCDYIHYNPVKHGHARCPHAWPYSSFRRFVQARRYPLAWLCTCNGANPVEPAIDIGEDLIGE